jgi:hypothetical protein
LACCYSTPSSLGDIFAAVNALGEARALRKTSAERRDTVFGEVVCLKLAEFFFGEIV